MKIGDLVKHKNYSELGAGIITRKPNHMFCEVFWGALVIDQFGRSAHRRMEPDAVLEVINEGG
jgi:hypothetical protein